MSDYSWHTYLPQNRTSFLCTFPKVKLKNWVTRHTYGSETKKPINLYSKNTSLSFIVRRWLDIIRHDWTCRIEFNLEFSNIFCSDFDLRVKCKENGVFSVGNSTVRRSILRMFCQFVFSHKKRTFVKSPFKILISDCAFKLKYSLYHWSKLDPIYLSRLSFTKIINIADKLLFWKYRVKRCFSSLLLLNEIVFRKI
jgi:hypothetical protein